MRHAFEPSCSSVSEAPAPSAAPRSPKGGVPAQFVRLASSRKVHLHAQERGTSIFIVTMAVVLLTGVGTWAMHSAGLTDRASGHFRQGAQAQFLAEAGVMAGTGTLSISGMAAAHYAAADASANNADWDDCRSVPTTAANRWCKAIARDDINVTVQEKTTDLGATFDVIDVTNAQGSLGPYASTSASALDGDFMLEISGGRPVQVQGDDLGRGDYERVTITSYGIVKPAGGGFCSANQNSVAGMVTLRAHAIIGPTGR